jgi:hypothetical protein
VLQTPAPFEYERATSVEGAIASLQRLGSEARIIAGGVGDHGLGVAEEPEASRVALTPDGLSSGSGGPAPGHPWSVPDRRSSSTRRPSSQPR